MFKKLFVFFDKLEDKIRFRLSHYPILYATVGAVGIILVWKGVWETFAYFPALFGLPSFAIGVVILLLTGLMVSFFIGESILISGYKHDKKLTEKTEEEVRSEMGILEEIRMRLDRIEREIKSLK